MKILTMLTQIVAELIASRRALTAIRAEQLSQRKLLETILTELQPGPAVSFFYEVTDPATGQTQTYEGDFQMIQNRNTTRQVKLTPKDSDGNVTTLDGPVVVTSSNPAVIIEGLSEDGLAFSMRTSGLAGIGPISLEGDADRTAGVSMITGNIDVTVPPGDAVTLVPEIGEEVANI